jgi:hypothetical protein
MSNTVDPGRDVRRVWLVSYGERNAPIEELGGDRWKTEKKWEFSGVGSRAEGGPKEKLGLRLMVRQARDRPTQGPAAAHLIEHGGGPAPFGWGSRWAAYRAGPVTPGRGSVAGYPREASVREPSGYGPGGA